MFKRLVVLTFSLALALAGNTSWTIAQVDLPSQPLLRLHRGTFDARAAAPALAPALGEPAPGPYAIIQFSGPITLDDKSALERMGVGILEYLPDFAYLVRGTPAQLDAAARLPSVYARTPFTLADKLAPSLLQAIKRGDSVLGPIHITGWPGDAGDLDRDLQALNAARQVDASSRLLLEVARLESVRWIEPAGRPRLLNDYARTIMHVGPVWQSTGYYGAGQKVAIADSGLDTGDLGTLSADFAGRISATQVLSAGQNWDDNFGHGTHVAGSLAGAGVRSGAVPALHQYNGSFAGVAPEASLVIQAFEVATDGSIIGLDPDYYQLFAQAYSDGARVHSDSWGDYTGPISDTAATFGRYPYGAQRTDQFIWDHPDMAIFVAAGNSGKDGTPDSTGLFCLGGDGVIDPDSLLSPGTAKNVITVGATESNRSSGGLGSTPWILLNLCFGNPPIAIDALANNANGMAAFSSRGPADDGRVKPDVVAPGTNIVSDRSHGSGAGTLWGQYENNADYVYSGGTSMATPLTAGAGVLARQWLIGHGLANPSAAALKATLLNTTYDIAPGQYGTGATQEVPLARPNGVDGWGRIDLSFMSAQAPYRLWVDDHAAGLSAGQALTYTHSLSRPLRVVNSTVPLRVMLAWTDLSASLSAASQLVNDLDLTVIGPDGTVYRGNGGTAADRKNNVEGVIVNNPPAGDYQIRVSAYNLPISQQPYALAVSGGFILSSADLAVTKTATPAYALPGARISYSLNYTNAGPSTANGTIITDIVPSELMSVTYTSSGVITPTGNASFAWQAGDLLAGRGGIITVTGWVKPNLALGTTFTNTAVIASDVPDTNGANNTSRARVVLTRSIYLPIVMKNSP